MRKYLSTIHKRPDGHKRRFAFFVSAGFTLAIFLAWTAVNFGAGGAVAQSAQVEANRAHPDISPFQSMSDQLGASFEGIKSSFSDLGKAKDALDQSYSSIKSDTLNSYGQ